MIVEDSHVSRRCWLNDHEQTALEGLVHGGYLLAYVMYVSGFRARMDWNTRTVGRTRPSRVSLSFFEQMLERHGKQGSQWLALRPTRNEIRGEINALEKAGLLERLPKPRRTDPMLFKLPLADTGLIRPQDEPQMNHKASTTKVVPINTGAGGDMNHKGTTGHEPHITKGRIHQHQADLILDCYHEHLPNLPRVNLLSDRLFDRMSDIWRLDERHQQRAFWEVFFGKRCKASDFLMGRDFAPGKGKFVTSLVWLLDKPNFERVMNQEFS